MLGGITLITLALTYVDIQLTVWNDAGWQLESVTKNKKNTKKLWRDPNLSGPVSPAASAV